MSLLTRARTWLARAAACAAMCCTGASFAQLTIPANDLCENATVLTVNQYVVGNTIAATAVNDGPVATGDFTITSSHGVWFSFTPATTGRYSISCRQAPFDTQMAVFDAVDCVTHVPGNFHLIPNGTNDQAGATPPAPGAVAGSSPLVHNVLLTASVTYYIRFSSFSSGTGGWYEIGVLSLSGNGACCANNGVCTITPAYQCSAFGSSVSFMGAGSVCSPSPCLGACCSSLTITCSISAPFTSSAGSASACGGSGNPGIFQGFGTTCTVGVCDLGRCCTTGGGCSITFQKNCTGSSLWASAGLSCDPISVCNGAVAACCNNNTGACTSGNVSCPTGTTNAGFGSTCGSNPCNFGSCCSTGLVCTRTLAPNCQTSLFYTGTSCASGPCSAACCATNGSCVLIAAGANTCPTGYSSAQVGSACSPVNPCAFGACCSASTCTLAMGRVNCGQSSSATANFYAGDNTTCSPDNVCLATLGGCCSISGTTITCTITSLIGCTGSNVFQGVGTNYAGTGTSCTSSASCALGATNVFGTCCSSTGVCSITTFNGCAGASTFLGVGVNQNGAGTACSSTTYCSTDVGTSLLGTCCSSGGTCSVTTALGCSGASTFSFGGSTSACAATAIGNASNPCTATLGACCNSPLSTACTVTTAAGCVFPHSFKAAGYAGAPATTCTAFTCQDTAVFGACCSALATGTCTVTTQNGCTGTNVWQGYTGYTGTTAGPASTACDASFCLRTNLYGACCNGTTCTVTTQAGCPFPQQWTSLGNGYAGGAGVTTCSSTAWCQGNTSGAVLLGARCAGALTSGCSVTTQANCQPPAVWQGVGDGTNGYGPTGGASLTTCTASWCQGANIAAAVYGACCSGTASATGCTVTTAAACAAIAGTNGNFLGVGAPGYTAGTACSTAGTYCNGNTSGAVLYGACCAGTTCTATLQAACLAPATWYSAGYTSTGTTTCQPSASYCQIDNSGAFLVGPCCDVNGNCTVTLQAACTGGGTWSLGGAGTGYTSAQTTSCVASWCQGTNNPGGAFILGACCLADGSCVARTTAGCQGNKFYAGAGVGYTTGTACAPTTYCNSGAGSVLGACCSTTTGACAQTSSGGCVAPNSFQTVGSTCSPSNPCGGACCTAATCMGALNAGSCFGTFIANGLCSPDPCASVRGACCNTSTYACSLALVGSCPAGTTAAGGAGSTCAAPAICYSSLANNCQDFEGVTVPALPTNWISLVAAGAPTATDWVTSAVRSHSTSRSVFVTNVAATSDVRLTMPAITAGGNLILDLWSSFSTEASWDGWVVEVSHDSGTTWTDVGTAAWILNPYNLASLSGGTLAGRPAFNGDVPTWTEHVCSIPATFGETIFIRFRMSSDSSGVGVTAPPGVFLDDICVYGVAVGAGACCAGNGSCTTTTNIGCTSPNLFEGIGSTCSGALCPESVGGCCSTSGGCVTMNSANCTIAAGYYNGNGIACGAVACPSVGRCCTGTVCTTTFDPAHGGCAGGMFDGTKACSTSACAYCTANATNCTTDEAISQVMFNDITNPAAPDTGTPANCYTDFTSITTTIYQTLAYNITVNNPRPFSGDQCTVWFDWDQNNIFGDVSSGEQFNLTNNGSNTVFTGSITVPNTATIGTTRMRIRMNFTGTMSPCGTATYGEVEDYSVTIAQLAFGACCTTSSCVDGVTAAACLASNGVYQGDNSLCSGVTCFPPGRCCTGTTCSITFQADCASGFWTAAGSCSPNVCAVPCCDGVTGQCSIVATNTGTCAGTFGNPGDTCAATVCPKGACCTISLGTCAITGPAGCVGADSIYGGDGTTCATNPCPTGACCVPAYGLCVVITQAACGSSNGTYAGDATTCSGPCPVNLSCGTSCTGASTCSSVNGGFESGTAAGWTIYGTSTLQAVFTGTGPGTPSQTPHSGSWAFDSGPTATPPSNGIRQTIPANLGDIATISFWYSAEGAGPNEFLVKFDGVTLIDLVNDTTHAAWTPFTFTATVTNGANPVLDFAFYNSPAWDFIDDVSVCVQPGVGACCEINTGLCTSVAPASCGAGFTFLGGTCSPNPCPPPPGVCCRGSTCNAGITLAANCTVTAGSAAGAFFATPFTACNVPGNTTSPCCFADYDKMNGIQVADIFAFLNDWFAGRKYTIPGGDGAHGTLAVQNIFDFLNLWFAGGC